MPSRTELQERIIEYVKEHPDASNTEVADAVDCSESWVRQTISDNLESIIGETDISEFTIAITFSNPYSVYLSQDVIDSIGRNVEDIIKIEYETKGGRGTKLTNLKDKNNIDIDDEFHSRVYIIESLSDSLPDKYYRRLGRFTRNESSGVEIYSESDFKDFVEMEKLHTQRVINEADIIVGADLLGSAKEPESNEFVIIKDFRINKGILKYLLEKEGEDLLDMRPPDENDEVIRPDSVYFSHMRENVDEETKSKILSQKYFDISHRYIYGNYAPVSGPQLLNRPGRIIKVDEDNLELVNEKFSFGFIRSGDLSPKKVDELTQDIHIEKEGEELEVHRVVDHLDSDQCRYVFVVGSLYVRMNYREGSASFIHPGKPKFVTDFIKALANNISEATDVKFTITDSESLKSGGSKLATSSRFVFDTNAIYNNVHSDTPESLLKTYFNNREFDGSELIVPWTVLYEINKHKDRGGPGPRVQEQGIENLNILKILDEFGFIKSKIENVPHSIDGQIGESDIADMHILQCSQNQGAVLISGDQRLREIASLSGVSVVDIRDIVEITDIPDISDSVRENIISKVGTEVKTKDEVLEAIEGEIDNQLQQSKHIETKSKISVDPSDYLAEWVSNGEIVPVVDKGGDESEETQIIYDRGNVVDVVLTPTAAGELTDDILEHNGDMYLHKSALEYLSCLPGVSGPGLPSITFHIPVSNVIAPQSTNLGGLSTTARQLYKLRDLKNANYKSSNLSEAMGRNEYIHDAVLLSREKEYPLLCAKEDTYLDRIAGLIDVNVVTYDK